MITFPGRLALQQRVLPSYRRPFFELLGERCQGGLSLFAGQPRPQEAINTVTELSGVSYTPAQNIHLFNGPLYLCRQPGLSAWLEDQQPDALVVEANPRYLSTPAAIDWMHEKRKAVLGWGLGAPPLHGPLAMLRQPAPASHAGQPGGRDQLQPAGRPMSTGQPVCRPSMYSWPITLPCRRHQHHHRNVRPSSRARRWCYSSGVCRRASGSTCCSKPAPPSLRCPGCWSSATAPSVKPCKPRQRAITRRPSSSAHVMAPSWTRYSGERTCSCCPAPAVWRCSRPWVTVCR